MLVRSSIFAGLVLLLSGCTSVTLSSLPAEEQQLWSRCQPSLRATCEHEVQEHHYASVNECLQADERDYASSAAGERRSYLQQHGCSATTIAGATSSGGAAPAAPGAAP